MDAQQRLLLETCWEALQCNTLGKQSSEGYGNGAARAVGVAVGVSYNEYFLNSRHQVCYL